MNLYDLDNGEKVNGFQVLASIMLYICESCLVEDVCDDVICELIELSRYFRGGISKVQGYNIGYVQNEIKRKSKSTEGKLKSERNTLSSQERDKYLMRWLQGDKNKFKEWKNNSALARKYVKKFNIMLSTNKYKENGEALRKPIAKLKEQLWGSST